MTARPNPIPAAVKVALFHEVAVDVACNNWIEKVESESGRDIPNLDSAYIAHRNGVTASDYALHLVEVTAR